MCLGCQELLQGGDAQPCGERSVGWRPSLGLLREGPHDQLKVRGHQRNVQAFFSFTEGHFQRGRKCEQWFRGGIDFNHKWRSCAQNACSWGWRCRQRLKRQTDIAECASQLCVSQGVAVSVGDFCCFGVLFNGRSENWFSHTMTMMKGTESDSLDWKAFFVYVWLSSSCSLPCCCFYLTLLPSLFTGMHTEFFLH